MKKHYSIFCLLFFLNIQHHTAQIFRKDSIHVFSWSNANTNWSHNTRELYTFDYEGTKETNLLRLIANGGTGNWVNFYQFNKNYNTLNNITESIQQNWSSDAWSNSARDTYMYNAQNNEIVFLYAIRVNDIWRSQRRETKIYDGNNVVSKTLEELDGSSLVPEDRFLYEYAIGSDRLTQEIEQIYFADVDFWLNVEKKEYNYTSFGALQKVESFGFNGSQNDFNDNGTEQTLYTYNALQQLTERTRQLRISGTYRNFERFVYAYTLGNQTELIIQEWVTADDVWRNKFRQLRTFDVDNNEIELIYQAWNSDINDWRNLSRTISFWSAAEAFDASTLSINSIGKNSYSVVVYPNPTANYININTNTSTPVHSVTLYNLQGKQILKTVGKTKIDIGHLAAGMYLVKIHIDNSMITKKIRIN
ncbi:T9SS type A sorting domain-containing protein [uncultured Kordia sp.]|uniref:T9SS type A sorting domain-containing protein n=1 Tax=uncultured Kordia sp. TaxID=507699 RepID=UPI00260883DF|nr:T9SS type A sorting domain-containing protein [uncultured Kordia sp.]